jgi:hypothetical protein
MIVVDVSESGADPGFCVRGDENGRGVWRGYFLDIIKIGCAEKIYKGAMST